MTDPHAYGIEVRRRTIDGEVVFEARVRELPDLAEYADTAEEAYALTIDAIATTADMLAERGKSMPPPLEPVDDWSGRVTLRLPKSLHRLLSETADDEGCSLNQHIVNVLNYFSGYAHAEQVMDAHWKSAPKGAPKPAPGRPLLKVVSTRDYPEQPAYAHG
ncbi:MAG TPA: toxin-antitoxin system HicB family antitoxin [Rhodanobacteraceae bacterium]|nr:toxin-antitoxin system HicB family antitoxin [Rhodanobacteraceae bacterium]